MKTLKIGLLMTVMVVLGGCPVPSESTSDQQDDNNTGGLVIHEGDYGDAPDDRDDATATPQALFPTKAASNGAHHLDTTQSALGYFLPNDDLPVSAELDATDPSDPDGEPNIDGPLGPDQDRYDDGFLIGVLPPSGLYEFPVVVSVASGAQEKSRYVNILADWNGDLEWGDTDPSVPEWVVQNKEVNVKPGTSERIFMPEARLGAITYGIWYRVTLSETPIDTSAFPDGWDGTGEFDEGETEDYIFVIQPQNELVFNDILYSPDLPGIPGEPPTVGDDDDDDDDPDGDGKPGINKKNIGKLRKIGPNTYRLVLCKGQTWQKGFEWETDVRNGSSSNPFAAGVGVGSDPGTVRISAREVGTTRVSFEANVKTFPVETTEWVTGVIYVTVIDCSKKEKACAAGQDDDDDDDNQAVDKNQPVDLPEVDQNDPFSGIDQIRLRDIGKLRHAQGDTYYLVLCLCEEDGYERGFQYQTRVRNPQSGDSDVADLDLQNDPGRIRIRLNGLGSTTLTFEADPVTFPYDNVSWNTITIHIMVIECPEEYYLMMMM